jgi:hypothetical protein
MDMEMLLIALKAIAKKLLRQISGFGITLRIIARQIAAARMRPESKGPTALSLFYPPTENR